MTANNRKQIEHNVIEAQLPHKSLSRRSLFRGVLNGARSAVEKQKKAENTRRLAARPPGAVDEALFLRLCDGCQKCLEVCPQQVIEWHDDKPQLNLDYNHCDLCMECHKVCHSQALTEMVTQDIGYRPVFSKSCNNKISTHCEACATRCPVDAIIIEPRQLPIINKEKCNGCGQCRTACYIGAVELKLL